MIFKTETTSALSAAIYACGHFLTDFLCASLMLRLSPAPWLFFTYNFCAFALQMPIGILADILGRNHRFACIGVGLTLLAILPLPTAIRVTLAGVGNAFYHVGGGRDALLANKRMTRLGVFVSPGALGICFGSMFCYSIPLFYAGAVLLLLCGVGILLQCRDMKRPVSASKAQLSPAVLMLAVVILRSVLGLSMETPWKVGNFVIAAGIAAAAGKALGGWLGDQFGGRTTGTVTLLISAVLFCFPDAGIVGVIGVLFFNMTMPITLRRASDAIPGMEGLAFGLLTFGLFLGYLPAFCGISAPGWLGSVLCAVSALLIWLDGVKRRG